MREPALPPATQHVSGEPSPPGKRPEHPKRRSRCHHRVETLRERRAPGERSVTAPVIRSTARAQLPVALWREAMGAVEAEADLQPPRFLAGDDADVCSVELSRGHTVGLRCSVRARDAKAAVQRASAFYERRVGRPRGNVLERRAFIGGDLVAEDEGPEPGGTNVPRAPLPVEPTTGARADVGSSA